ncbi:MAG TPA: hypothetical protein VI566_07265 [Xanthomonadales bacterium]|nr:hypothetical protein [Xanthomonadales bacterium]
MKTRILVLSVVTLALAACAVQPMVPHTRSGNLKNVFVEFTAAPGADKLMVHSPNQGCTHGSAGNGCVAFGKGELGTLTFQFRGNQKYRDCHTTPAAEWVITRMQLSAQEDPATNKDQGVFGGAQPDWLVEAFPGVDAQNGLLYENTAAAATKTVTFINLNDHDSTQGEKVIYYQVTASRCDGAGQPIKIDPSVRNTGK